MIGIDQVNFLLARHQVVHCRVQTSHGRVFGWSGSSAGLVAYLEQHHGGCQFNVVILSGGKL